MNDIKKLTQNESENRFLLFREVDPFPSIEPALLNSADVSSYIQTIGMVWPFDVEQLKGVTLGLKIGDIALYWDENKKKVKKNIKSDREFVLKSNSIAYVEVKEELRLPAYIIARFNLRVTNAYRGILLGTGPIVDPGFEGKLYIPLHNLTSNDYVLYHEDPFIEMEFTKLSRNSMWDKPAPAGVDRPRDEDYKDWKPNDKRKLKDRDIEYYIQRANQGRSIDSSLPALNKDTKDAIEKATKLSDKVDTALSRYNVGLLFSFAGLIGVIFTLVNMFKGDIKEIRDKKYDEKIRYLEDQHLRDSMMIDSISKRVFVKP